MNYKIEKTDSFLCNCKLLYFSTAVPGKSQNLAEYQRLEFIAKEFFSLGESEHINQYLQLTKYQVNLWAAYLILKYGKPDLELETTCREILKSEGLVVD